jgi:phage shock protein PspC (stress-responsive transcriptional regulator)
MSDEYKRLYRNTEDRIVAGVCAGLAKYFKTDPVFIRLLAVLFLFSNPPAAVVIYAVMMAVVAEAPAKEESPTS